MALTAAVGVSPRDREVLEWRRELTQHRDQLVIATKGGLRRITDGVVRDASPGWLRAGVDASAWRNPHRVVRSAGANTR